jgi:hypothetical protein
LITDAKADSAEKLKVAVGAFDGSKSDDARSAFIEALKQDGGYEVTDAEDVKASGKASALADSAKGLGVNAIITGKVSKGFALKLKVFGSDGKAVDEVDVKGGSLAKLKTNIGKSGVSSVASALGKTKPASDEKPEEAKPAEEESTEEDKSGDSASASVDTNDLSGGKGLSPLDVTAGLRPLHRTFEFHDAPYPMLKYELPLGPSLFIDLNWYPGSHFAEGPAEWFGITGGFEKGFAVKSIYGEGTATPQTLKTNMQAFYVGGRFRFPIGTHEVGAAATYGQHQFDLDGDDGPCSPPTILEPCPKIPDVKYSYVKVGLDATLRFGDFMVGARVGKRFVSSTGKLQTVWFPHVKTQSLEAGLTLGYRLARMLDLVAGVDWLRYGFDFNPVPSGRRSYVAGGAIDEYLSGNIGFRFHIPGKGEPVPE